MPSTRARRLCPHAVFLAGRYDLYSEYSRRIHEVFKSFTPLVEGIALDEAFLDVTGARRLFGEPAEIASLIRARIHDDARPERVGGRRDHQVRGQARVGGGQAAPPTGGAPVPGAGVVVVAPGEELAFLHPLPVQALWGVGPATRQRLERFGVRTIGDLAALPEASLVTALGPAVGHHLHQLAWAARRPRGRARAAGEVDRSRGDLRARPPRARAVAARSRAPGRLGGVAPAQARPGRSHREHQGPLPRLPHDHALAHAAGGRSTAGPTSRVSRPTCSSTSTRRRASACSA